MILTPRNISVSAVSLVLAACAAPATNDVSVQSEPTQSAETDKPAARLGPAISTIKPGASVSFSHATPGPVQVGGNGFVTLTINEGYSAGVLSLAASADDGLEVAGTSASTTMNMSDGGTHSWRVDFRGLADGVHYLNVMAMVDTGERRGYAIPIQVGDWKTVEDARKAAKPMQEQADGEMAIILEAQETIE
jgi:hypothetical protein